MQREVKVCIKYIPPVRVQSYVRFSSVLASYSLTYLRTQQTKTESLPTIAMFTITRLPETAGLQEEDGRI